MKKRKDNRDRREYYKQHRLQNIDHHRNYRLNKEFNISLEEYNQMSEAQNHVCAICSQPETLTINGKVAKLAVDHCHSTKHVRQLLCRVCNTTLGAIKEDTDILQKMIDYLKLHSYH
jgi:predicted transcriptional regulator